MTVSEHLMVLQSTGTNKDDKEDVAWTKWNMDNDESLKDKNAERSGNGVPKRQLQAGQDYGLSIVVRMDKGSQLCPLTDGKGLMLSIQNPAEQPQIRRYGFLVQPNHETTVQLTTNLVKSTDKMEGMEVAERKCYLNTDYGEFSKSKFEYFKYTEGNCQEACFAHAIQENCKCIPLSLSAGNKSVVICGPEMEQCIRENKIKIVATGFSEKTCKLKCYPECNRVSYIAERSSVPYDDFVDETAKKNLGIPEDEEFTTIHVYQKYDDIDTEEAQGLRIFIIFIGTIGGILGLTSGFNLMTPFNLAKGILHIVLSYLMKIPGFKKFYESIFGPFSEITASENVDPSATPPIPESPLSEHDDHANDNDAANGSEQPGGENETTNNDDDTTSQVQQDPVVPFDAPTPSPPRSAHRRQISSAPAAGRSGSGRFPSFKRMLNSIRRRKTLDSGDDPRDMIPLVPLVRSETTSTIVPPATPSPGFEMEELGPLESEVLPPIKKDSASGSSSPDADNDLTPPPKPRKPMAPWTLKRYSWRKKVKPINDPTTSESSTTPAALLPMIDDAPAPEPIIPERQQLEEVVIVPRTAPPSPVLFIPPVPATLHDSQIPPQAVEGAEEGSSTSSDEIVPLPTPRYKFPSPPRTPKISSSSSADSIDWDEYL
ncbi:Pickpocket protein 28 [Folsomia candida]|uniref:Pickpocket protein 28 n=1 Tax=Folsomia candida TaxID=158441 RepID=A0A226DE18_FOLCA|nr:Pickpocket protein 28 [Folsomia candida]